jgi:outer membrane protein assembly factor BamB
MDTRSGATVWSFQSDLTGAGDWTSNPQVDEVSGLVFTSTLKWLYALDGHTGDVVWQHALINAQLG